MKTFLPHKRSTKALLAVATLATAGGVGTFMLSPAAIGDQPQPFTLEKSNRPALVDSFDPSVKRAIEQANGLSVAFQAVSKAMLPSIVAIETRTEVAMAPQQSNRHGMIHPSSQDPLNGNPFEGTPLEDFFDDAFGGAPFQLPPNRGMQPYGRSIPKGRMVPKTGIGSGVVIDESGIILTNNHVVSGGTKVIVKTLDGREYEAVDVLTDPTTDIAVVRIEGATNLTAATLGDSDSVGVGEWVLALGQPFGLESTVTAGIISAKHRGIGITDRENFLQTDAAINPGNSGGPLVNLRGEIVGINTAIHSRTGANNGIGFAVPSNMARWVAEQLVNDGKVRRAYLGVGIQAINQELAEQMNVPPRGGVVVTEVFDGTPAATIGLQSGDVIIDFGGEPVTTAIELQRLVEKTPFGSNVPINVVREGKHVSLSYLPSERPAEFGQLAEADPVPEQTPKKVSKWGLHVTSIDKKLAEQLKLQDNQGVVITEVAAGSSAEVEGLSEGMVIKQIDRQPVNSVDDFLELMDKADRDVLLLVATHRGSRFVVLTK